MSISALLLEFWCAVRERKIYIYINLCNFVSIKMCARVVCQKFQSKFICFSIEHNHVIIQSVVLFVSRSIAKQFCILLSLDPILNWFYVQCIKITIFFICLCFMHAIMIVNTPRMQLHSLSRSSFMLDMMIVWQQSSSLTNVFAMQFFFYFSWENMRIVWWNIQEFYKHT